MANQTHLKRAKISEANEEKKVSENFNHQYIFVQEDPKQNVNPESQTVPVDKPKEKDVNANLTSSIAQSIHKSQEHL